jgi:hypothetical protein
MPKSIYQEECDELRARLDRLEQRYNAGLGAADYVPVSVDTLRSLLDDLEDLGKIEHLVHNAWAYDGPRKVKAIIERRNNA